MDNESFNGDRTEIRIEGLAYAYSVADRWETVSLAIVADTGGTESCTALKAIYDDLRAHGFNHPRNSKSMFDGSPVIVVTADRAIKE